MTTRLAHVAFWTGDLDRLAQFYARYFGARPGPRYCNEANGFESVFLSFEGGAQLELMRTTQLEPISMPPGAQRMGLTHLAIAVGPETEVDRITVRLGSDGFQVLDGPRRTGDGYYESVVLDPDGNRVEVVAG
jgi:lactoylglutathione lyase